MVDTTAVYGHMHPVRMRMPVFTGALGSTDIARKYWESFAVGAAISGISLVVGENVCGIDPGRVRQGRPHQALARDGAPHQDLQAVAGGATATSSCR